MTKSERVLKRSDFLAASREPDHRVVTRNFLALFKKNQTPVARLGVTVTKKIGKAAVRNRLKRQLREFFRHNKSMLPPGRDVILIARKGADRLSQAEIYEQLRVIKRVESC